MFLEQPPELDALERWQHGDFMEIERLFAKGWRQTLAALDLRAYARRLGVNEIKVRNLEEAKLRADRAVWADGRRLASLKAAVEMLDVPEQWKPQLLRRWKQAGGPPLPEFAPYAAYVFCVDLFFYISVGSGLISAERASNRKDVAYLYYLPFCMVFVSNDKLHARTAPLFMDADQEFVRGNDLKADLGKLDAHYSALPVHVQERGVMAIAPDPPKEGDFLTARLWDRFLPGWRDRSRNRLREKVGDEALLKALRPMLEAAERSDRTAPIEPGASDHTIVSRKVPVRRGKWRIVPPEAEGTDSE